MDPDHTELNLNLSIDGEFHSLKSNSQFSVNDAFLEDFFSGLSNTDKGSVVESDLQKDLDLECKSMKSGPESPDSDELRCPAPVIGQVSVVIEKLKKQNQDLIDKSLKQECELAQYEENLSEKLRSLFQLQGDTQTLKEKFEAADNERTSLRMQLEEKEAELVQFKELVQNQVNDEDIQAMKKDLLNEKKVHKKTERDLQRCTELLNKKKNSLKLLRCRNRKLATTLAEFGHILESKKLLSSKHKKYLDNVKRKLTRGNELNEESFTSSEGESTAENNPTVERDINFNTVNGPVFGVLIKKEENSSYSNGAPVDSSCNPESYINGFLDTSIKFSPHSHLEDKNFVDSSKSHKYIVAPSYENGEIPLQQTVSVQCKIEETCHEKVHNQKISLDKTSHLSPDSNFLPISSGTESLCSEDLEITDECFSEIKEGIKGWVLKSEDYAPLSPLPPSPAPKCNTEVESNCLRETILNSDSRRIQNSNEHLPLLQVINLSQHDVPASQKSPECSLKRNILSHQISKGFEPHIKECPESINSSLSKPMVSESNIPPVHIPPELHYLSSTYSEANNFKILHQGGSVYDYLVNPETKLSVCVLTVPHKSSLHNQTAANMPSSSIENARILPCEEERMKRVLSVYRAAERRLNLISNHVLNSDSSQQCASNLTDENLSRICVVVDGKNDLVVNTVENACVTKSSSDSGMVLEDTTFEDTQDNICVPETVEQQTDNNQSFVSSSCDVSPPSKRKLLSSSFNHHNAAQSKLADRKQPSKSFELSNVLNSERNSSNTASGSNAAKRIGLFPPERIVLPRNSLPENSLSSTNGVDGKLSVISNTLSQNSLDKCYKFPNLPKSIDVTHNVLVERQCSSPIDELNVPESMHIAVNNFNPSNSLESSVSQQKEVETAETEDSQTVGNCNSNYIKSPLKTVTVSENVYNAPKTDSSVVKEIFNPPTQSCNSLDIFKEIKSKPMENTVKNKLDSSIIENCHVKNSPVREKVMIVKELYSKDDASSNICGIANGKRHISDNIEESAHKKIKLGIKSPKVNETNEFSSPLLTNSSVEETRYSPKKSLLKISPSKNQSKEFSVKTNHFGNDSVEINAECASSQQDNVSILNEDKHVISLKFVENSKVIPDLSIEPAMKWKESECNKNVSMQKGIDFVGTKNKKSKKNRKKKKRVCSNNQDLLISASDKSATEFPIKDDSVTCDNISTEGKSVSEAEVDCEITNVNQQLQNEIVKNSANVASENWIDKMEVESNDPQDKSNVPSKLPVSTVIASKDLDSESKCISESLENKINVCLNEHSHCVKADIHWDEETELYETDNTSASEKLCNGDHPLISTPIGSNMPLSTDFPVSNIKMQLSTFSSDPNPSEVINDSFKESQISELLPIKEVNSESNVIINSSNGSTTVINQHSTVSAEMSAIDVNASTELSTCVKKEMLEEKLVSSYNNSLKNEIPTVMNNYDSLKDPHVKGLLQNQRRFSCQSTLSFDENPLVIDEDMLLESNVVADKIDCPAEVIENSQTSVKNSRKKSKNIKRKKAKSATKTKKKSKILTEEEFIFSIAKILEEIEADKIHNSSDLLHFKRHSHTLTNALINPSNACNTASVLFQIFNHLRFSRTNPLMSFPIEHDISVFFPLTEKCIVSSFIQAERKKKSHLKGLLPESISNLNLLVLAKESISKTGLSAFCRVFTELCKYVKDRKKPILLCCDLIKLRHKFAPYLIASIMGVWPELFSVTDETSEEEVVLQSSIAYGIEKKPQKLTSADWKQCKTVYSKYMMSSPVSDVTEKTKNLIEITEKFLEENPTENDYLITEPLLIFSACEDWNWVQENLLNNFVLPSLAVYAQQKNDERAFTVFCNLYTEIGLLGPDIAASSEILEQLFIIREAHSYVKDCAVRSLIKLYLLSKHKLPGYIFDWVGENESKLRGTPTELLLKQRLMSDCSTFTENDIISL